MKLKRDTFLYMDPVGNPNDFAQCVSCRKFVPEKMMEGKVNHDCCAEFGPKVRVGARWSCGLYSPWPDGKVNQEVVEFHAQEMLESKGGKMATPSEAGLVNREVRCENCAAFDGKHTCLFFKEVNDKMSDVFERIDTDVKAKACCNAQHPKAKNDAILDGSAVARRIKRE